MHRAKRPSSSSNYVASTKVSLKELSLPESWLEKTIRADPAILGLGRILKENVSFQRRYKNAGRCDLILLDEDNSVRYCAELMLDEVDETHIVRCIEYWLTESLNPSNKDLSVIAVLAAERIRESRYFPVIEYLSRKLPLTVLEVAALKVSGHTTLTFTKFFDGIDQIERVEATGEGSDRAEVDRDYWIKKRSAGIIRTADSLARIFRSPSNQLQVTYLQNFWGFKLGEKPKNFVSISPRQKFVNVRARIRDTEGWRERLDKAGFDVTGGIPRKSVRFRVTDHKSLGKRTKLLKELAQEAFVERNPDIQGEV